MERFSHEIDHTFGYPSSCMEPCSFGDYASIEQLVDWLKKMQKQA